MAAGPVSERNQDATIYVGGLDEKVTEPLLWELFVQGGPVVNVHMPKDRITLLHQGYGFVEFLSEDDADYACKIMNMIKLFGKPIRVNKASAHQKNLDVGANIFIGNLDPEVDEKLLYDTFSAFGVILQTPKIMRDPTTGNSKGFAFINFASFDASDAAIEAMNGQYLCNRPITISYAFKKDAKGERHGSAAERLLAAQNPLAQTDRPHQLFADAPPMPPPMAAISSMIGMAPGMPPPPPPPPPCSLEVGGADDPLPPPPSPIIEEYADNGALSASLSTKTTYHKESYMVHRKNLGTHYRRSSDNISTSESAVSPSSWEKHYNVRKGSTTPTVIFSSEDMSKKEVSEPNETCSEQPKSYISEITFQTGLNVSLSPSGEVESKAAIASVDTPQHSYRSLTPTNSERFTYLKKISEGNWTDVLPNAGSKPNLYKLSDPGPRSLMELNTSNGLHHRSHSDSERYKVERTQPVISARIADDYGDSIARNQSVSKISSPLEGKSVAVEISATWNTVDTPSIKSSCTSPLSLQSNSASPSATSPGKLNSCAPLPATSVYFTTSEPKAKLLTRYVHDIQNETTSEPINSELLVKKKEELVARLAHAEAQEKMVLEGKRDKLIEQLEEAKRLKENIDRRSRQVSNLLTKYLSEDEFTDYTHFVTMKAKLVMDQREIDDKIKLGEEQLAALKETLHFRPRI
nr:EOG090X0BVS [Cyclestheria hislopi]